MMMLALVVLGAASANHRPLPDVDIPVAMVQTVYPGASGDHRARVSKRLEEAFNPVRG
jgi:multidrug efflux pump subunit AcrB